MGGDGCCCAGCCTTGGAARCRRAPPRGSPSEPVRLGTAALCCCGCGCCGCGCCCCGCGCCCRGAFWLRDSCMDASFAAWAGAVSTCRATEASSRTLLQCQAVSTGHLLQKFSCLVRQCRCGTSVAGGASMLCGAGCGLQIVFRSGSQQRRGYHLTALITPWLPWSPWGSPEGVAHLAGRSSDSV